MLFAIAKKLGRLPEHIPICDKNCVLSTFVCYGSFCLRCQLLFAARRQLLFALSTFLFLGKWGKRTRPFKMAFWGWVSPGEGESSCPKTGEEDGRNDLKINFLTGGGPSR